jgi:hypothetical protein
LFTKLRNPLAASARIWSGESWGATAKSGAR